MIVAIDKNTNDVTGFIYKSAGCEVEVKDHNFSNEVVFIDGSNQSRFCVKNGEVHKKTDKELKAEPEYLAYQKAKRAAEYTKEADAVFFKYQRGEATEKEWKEAVQKVKDKYPY